MKKEHTSKQQENDCDSKMKWIRAGCVTLGHYDIPANTAVTDLEKKPCCLLPEDLPLVGMATANGNNL